MKRTVLIPLLLSGGVLAGDGGVTFSVKNQWLFENVSAWDSKQLSAELNNQTSVPKKVEGLRLTIPNKPSTLLNYSDPGISVSNFDDGTADRYEMRIKGENSNTNQKYNRISGNTIFTIPLEASGIKKGADFTPEHPQYLIKTGSFATDKFYKNAQPISLEYLKNLSDNWAPYYDEDLYICDTLGAFGGPVSAGFIDTWYDQVGDSALYQVQVGIPDHTIKQNGITARLNLGIMGEESGGAGPLFAMSLIAEQELMNVDMQLLIASGTNEKQSALQEVTYDIDYNINGFGGSAFLTTQDDMQLGPFNFIMSSYKGYILDGNRKFFPYDSEAGGDPYFYVATPGMGKSIGGNSPQLVNATLLSSLYYWFLFDGFFNFKNVWVEDVFRRAADRRIAAKLALNAWRYGFTTDSDYGANILYDQPAVITTPDVTTMIDKTEYIHLMENAMLPLLDANIRSVNNGGTCEIHDDSISLADFESFFFGMDGDGYTADGATGSLGKGGLLWHYSVTQEMRVQLWSDVTEAFNYLKNRAPSTRNLSGEYVSLRYDFLAILRVARQYFDIERPMPSGIEFERFVQKHSTPDVVSEVSGKQIENIYPILHKGAKAMDPDNTFRLTINASDETYMNVDSAAVVEWTLNPEWLDWQPAVKLSGDTLSAVYEVTIPGSVVDAVYGDNGGIGWVRVSDRNFNTTVDTFYIEGVKYPSITGAFARDRDGDGVADSLVVTLVKGGAEGAFELNSWLSSRYSWPTQDLGKSALPGERDAFDGTSKISLVDTDLTEGAGMGKIQFTYPENSVVSADIADSVGPAITTASIPLGNSVDSLTITTSEPIQINTAVSSPLLFKTGTTLSSQSPDAIEVKSSTELLLLFESSKGVASAEFVKFQYEQESVQDMVGNTPLDSNQWVPISRSGSETVLDGAAAFDAKGNGFATEIRIAMNWGSSPESVQFEQISSLLYTWNENGTETTLSSGSFSLNNGTIVVPIDTVQFRFGEGTGTITLNSSDTAFSATVEDSVGPALTAARAPFTENSADRSIVVTTSEKIDTDFSQYKDLFLLIRGDQVSSLPISAIAVTGETELTLTVAFDAVQEGDSLAIDRESEAVDQKGNHAHTATARQEILFEGGKLPSIERAEMYDRNGDGEADSITVVLSLGSSNDRDEADDCSKGEYSWPAKGNVSEASVSVVDPTSLVLSGFTADQTEGEGELKLTFPSGTATGTLFDRVGPVLTEAILPESFGDQQELYVTFSESVKELSELSDFLVINQNVGDIISVRTGSRTNQWIVTYANGTISEGDWVAIEETSTLRDDMNNEAHPENRPVQVQRVLRPVPLSADGHAFYDLNSDGSMDRLVLSFDVSLEESRLNTMAISLLWPNESGAVEPVTFAREDLSIQDKEIVVHGENYSFSSEITSVDSELYGTVTVVQPDFFTDMDDSSRVVPADSMAPVLVGSARYLGKKISSESDAVVDTLVLTFSEPIRTVESGSGNSNLYDLYDGSGNYTITTFGASQENQGRVIFTVSAEGIVQLPATGDSIRISGIEELVTDLYGNVQRNATPYVPFAGVSLPASFELQVAPNPFTPGSLEPNELLSQYGVASVGKMGIVLRPFKNRISELKDAEIIVFDVIGNVVFADSFDYLPEHGVLVCAFDGKNRGGRKLGSGQYIGVVTVVTSSDGADQEEVIQLKIGIKK